ncbi:MAG: DUF3987 domain-containing protein [Patescibacteria group bacterium]|nr:DUF3987 domain-containing protein [Patescibacteria group bacterium]
MTRNFNDWIPAFLEYSQHTESPKLMRFWAGVGAIAGALRRKVWIDQHYFRWTPNFFIIFVAPPGIVSKSTTADIAMDLLREIPGIKFGPDVVTWPALVSAFASSCESFEYQGEYVSMSPLTLVASELGNLINPQDKEMINLFINLWDGRKKLEKITKMSGSDIVEAPWINMVGCTTPHWIADNMPSATVGGGFTSRCIFVYADKKERYVAYPKFNVPKDAGEVRLRLIQDLEYISINIAGEYELSKEAIKWGENWYQQLWASRPSTLDDDRLDGYVARKQTHLHKLAMVLAASQRDELVIIPDDLILANQMLLSTECDLEKVFSRIGRSEDSLQSERLLQFVERRGRATYQEAYRQIHAHFPDARDFEGIVAGAIKAGYIDLEQRGGEVYLCSKMKPAEQGSPMSTLDQEVK